MASLLFLKGVEQAFLGQINFESDTIKAMFMNPSFTPNAGTHQFVSDISASRASNTTDVTLANKDIRIDTGNSRVEFDADNLSHSAVTSTTDGIVLYKSTGVDATSPLIVWNEIIEGTLSPVAGTITITVNSEGFFAISST